MNADEEEFSRSPGAIAQRLRMLQARERIAQKRKEESASIKAPSQMQGIESQMKRLKTIYRIINGTSAVTVVGLIITFFVMNAQLILGNILKVKFVPPLGMIEKIIIIPLDIFMVFIFLVIISLLALSAGII